MATVERDRHRVPVARQGIQKVVINPVTRIEGHGKVTLHLDAAGRVEEARFHIAEFRGFERFVQGRLYWEVPTIVQRLCGICPVSHHLCASKAMDIVAGVDAISPTAEKIRRLAHYGQVFQSHALHFFHLASPDLLFGFDAPVEQRNVIGVIHAYPEVAKKAVLMRKYGQEVIKAALGKKIHGTGSLPGGVNKTLTLEEVAALKSGVDDMVAWAQDGLALCKEIVLGSAAELLAFGAGESNYVSLLREDGALELYDGTLRAIDPEGKVIFEGVAAADYLKFIAEEVRPWSYMKFPFIRSLGKEKGWYRVGPLARVNNCRFIDSPKAEAEREQFMALGKGRPVHAPLAYHWARMIEALHCAEKMKEMLDDPDLREGELLRRGTRRPTGIAVLEAPRGTLFHHYEVDQNDQITRANLIVSTTNNNEAMNQVVRRVAEQYLDGQEITEGALNRIEVGIRAFDPCLSCATHALGQMPLVVQIFNAEGGLVHERRRA